jgi:hypothetical protein
VVVLDDYLVDRIEWESHAEHEIALPLHGVRVLDETGAPLRGVSAPIEGGDGREDGFAFRTSTVRLQPTSPVVRLTSVPTSDASQRVLDGWISSSAPATWWSAIAPGAPGRGARSMVLVRTAGRAGSLTAVWSWRGSVADAELSDGSVVVHRSGDVHQHRATREGWTIERTLDRPAAIDLRRSTVVAPVHEARVEQAASGSSVSTFLRLPLHAELGRDHYRRSEQSWEEAGQPTCTVDVRRSLGRLVVDVRVPRADRRFVDVRASNPFDNDPAAIHGDGVQLYVDAGAVAAGWLLVPIADSHDVGSRPIDGWSGALSLVATWRSTGEGYELSAEVELPPSTTEIGVDVLVNEISAGRARRRGQLVLSGADGEFVYLRSDRHDRERLLRFAVARA